MRLRRHPPEPELGAWFDGEHADGEVGAHVSHCSRCRRSLSEMARIRAWIRAQPFFAMGGDEPASSLGTAARRWRARAVAMSLLVVLSLLVVNAPRLRGPERGPATSSDRSRALFSGGSGEEARSPAAAQPAGPEQSAGQSPGQSARPGQGALRLGLVVPTRGPSAAEGAETAKVVRQRVEVANRAGGVNGFPVELVVAAAEDPAAVASLPKRVSVLAGGFGAPSPPGVPWLFPADPAVSGPDVVAAQPSPEAAGQHMGDLLRAQALGGPVGVVVGAGPESALAAGLGSRVPTTTAAAGSDASCASQVASLRAAGAVALAVAASPDVAVRCLVAAARALWAPRYGTMVTPSAAYAGLEAVTEARGTRTALGLPWPSWPAGGAARFRAGGGGRSYRALVSLAATELALDVAQRKGTVSPATLTATSWRSDMYEVSGTTIKPVPVVMAPTGWVTAPEIGVAPILPPILPIPIPGLSS